MKNVYFVCNFQFLSSRNLFATGVFDKIREMNDAKFVVLVHHYKESHFKEQFRDKTNVEVVGIDERIIKRNLAFKFFKWLSHPLCPSLAAKHRLGENLFRLQSPKVIFDYVVGQILFVFFSRIKPVKLLVRYFDEKFSGVDIISQLFDKYSPRAIFITDAFAETEVVLAQTAQKRHVLTIGMVRSWDNTTTKGFLRITPDFFVVNTSIVKEELHKYHYVPYEKIFIGGIPQYDLGFKKTNTSREEFLKKLNFDPNKKVLLFAPSGPALSDIDVELCNILKEGIINGQLPHDLQVIVRCHPGSAKDFLQSFTPNENFFLEYPGKKFEIKAKSTEMSMDDQIHLFDTLTHADVVLIVHTTLAIDALLMDKPLVVIWFDGSQKRPYYLSVGHYHREEHFQKLLNTNAARIAYSAPEMFSHICNYLEHPGLDKEKRKIAVEMQVEFLDGKSVERIASWVKKKFEEVAL